MNKLRNLLQEFDECQKRAQNEELRRQRLAYVNVSLTNVISDGKKKKKKHRGEGEEIDDDDDDEDSDSDSDSEVCRWCLWKKLIIVCGQFLCVSDCGCN